MKIEYRIQKDYIEIVRCYGVDSCVTLPAQIDGYPVKKVAAYTFSARKSQEDADVLTYESEDGLLLEENNKLLAGVDVEKVIFPETVEEIGNYIFYGCKELRYLEFSQYINEYRQWSIYRMWQIEWAESTYEAGREILCKRDSWRFVAADRCYFYI